MSNRIKVNDVYFELPEGALGRPVRIVAEKTDVPDMLDPVAFAPSKPDLVAKYLERPAAEAANKNTQKLPEAKLDQVTEWQSFTGQKSTHPQQWLKYVEGKQRHCGFNIWAALFGLQWFVFNKMYGQAVVVAFFEIFTVVMVTAGVGNFQRSLDAPSAGMALGLIILGVGVILPRVIVGYWANMALFRKASAEIEKIRSFEVNNERKLAMISAAGSGSVGSLLVIYAAIFIIRIIANSN
jgi:hypothetical protein